MLWRVRELLGCEIGAVDGTPGRIHDVYFDDQHWIVRYLAVDLGPRPASRRVLMCPASVRRIAWLRRRVDLAVTPRELRESPDVDTRRPIERQQEIALHQYYGFPYYWTGDRTPAIARSSADRGAAGAGSENRHLHSARVVIGYTLHAVDGETGHVEDFLVDEATWAVRYMVVDARHWWPGKRVLVASGWIGWMSWIERSVHVDLGRDTIHGAPGYDPARPVDAGCEARLRDHFGPPPDWSPGDRAA